MVSKLNARNLLASDHLPVFDLQQDGSGLILRLRGAGGAIRSVFDNDGKVLLSTASLSPENRPDALAHLFEADGGTGTVPGGTLLHLEGSAGHGYLGPDFARVARLELPGSTSGLLTLAVPAAVTSHTLTFPAAQGAVNEVLINDGSGGLSWAIAGGTGANTALSNLVSVAINTTLVSDLADTDDLGTDAIPWRTVYLRTSLVFDQPTRNVIVVATEPAGAARTYTIPDFGANDSFVALAAAQTLSGKKFSGNTAFGGTHTADVVVHVAKAVNGAFTGLLIENSQAAAGGSTNETAEIRFGFGGNNDVARITVTKKSDYTTVANEDSALRFWIDVNGTATQVVSILNSGLLLGVPASKLDFNGDVGGGGQGVRYKDAGGSLRTALSFPGSDLVVLSNQAANGVVQIRANTSTAGSGGEVTVITVEDTRVLSSQPVYIAERAAARAAVAGEGQLWVKTVVPNQLFFTDDAGTDFQLGVGGPSQATQAEAEAESDVDKYVPPDFIKHSPGVAKAWAMFNGNDADPITNAIAYNCDATTDHGTGDYSVNFTIDFSTSDQAIAALCPGGRGVTVNQGIVGGAVGSTRIQLSNTSNAALDGDRMRIVAFGDQ